MPTLFLSSRYTTESKILRSAAQALGWETFRCDGDRIPAGFAGQRARQAIYCTVPNAFNLARQLHSILLGCSSEWLPQLPEDCLKRKVELHELRNAMKLGGRRFMKPALGKSFDAAVRTGKELAMEATHLPPDFLVHASEVVAWEAEYRCFVANRQVLTLSPYRRGTTTFSSYANPLTGPVSESEAAAEFANLVINSVPCPAAFVLDVGIIQGRGWAVVESNECWGSGIYGCAPSRVLEVLLTAVVDVGTGPKRENDWNYAEHYFRACPHMRDGRKG